MKKLLRKIVFWMLDLDTESDLEKCGTRYRLNKYLILKKNNLEPLNHPSVFGELVDIRQDDEQENIKTLDQRIKKLGGTLTNKDLFDLTN